jgi:hypothetical protein
MGRNRHAREDLGGGVMTDYHEYAAEQLERAADVVDRGWCRHDWEDENGNVCAMGAINRVFKSNAYDYDAEFARRYVINVLRDVMKEQLVPDGYKHRFHGIMTMNDKMAKDGNEVATCMRKAAVMAREGYTPTALRWASPALDHGQYYHWAIVNTVVVHHNTTVASR